MLNPCAKCGSTPSGINGVVWCPKCLRGDGSTTTLRPQNWNAANPLQEEYTPPVHGEHHAVHRDHRMVEMPNAVADAFMAFFEAGDNESASAKAWEELYTAMSECDSTPKIWKAHK